MLAASDFDGIEQCLQDVGRQVFGRVVERTVAAIAAAQEEACPRCGRCQQPMRLVDAHRPRNLPGLVGDDRRTRADFFGDACQRGRAPLDERLGLGGGPRSPGLERVACWFAIAGSFQEGADALSETLRVSVADEPTRRVTEAIGAVAEAETQALGAQAQAGTDSFASEAIAVTSSILLGEVDGAFVQEVDGAWHEVTAGVAAPLGPTEQADEQTGRTTLAMGLPSYCGGFESAERFW